MADVDVKEIAVLKAYSSKLNDFMSGTTVVGALVDKQIRSLKDDLSTWRHDAANGLHAAQEQADKVISRYDYALSRCSNARPYIGETDYECKAKLREAEEIVERINDKIRRLETELENAGIHTKNFCLQTINMVEGCQSKMNQNISHLETYVQTQLNG